MYPIREQVFPPKNKFPVNELEVSFFESLHSKLTEIENSRIRLIRMSNGTLSVEYAGYPIGKVKLQGKKFFLQYFKSSFNAYDIEGSIEDFLPAVDYWVKYIRKL